MKKLVRIAAACVALLAARNAAATPSTLFWTPATTYVQPFLVPHITYDTYFNDKGAYPMDLGLTMGILPFEAVQMEVGLDVFLPYWSPIPGAGFFASPAGAFQANAKIALVENSFGDWFPGISAGIYGVGFTKGTSFDILHLEIGKTFFFGAITVGGYYGVGEEALWLGSNGSVNRAGFIGSYVTPDIVLDLKGLYKINFFADVQTGKNAFGAVGGGVGIYFTPSIDILTGPVFFLDKGVQPPYDGVGSSFMWSVQLDVDIDFAPAPKAPPAPAEAPKEAPKA